MRVWSFRSALGWISQKYNGDEKAGMASVLLLLLVYNIYIYIHHWLYICIHHTMVMENEFPVCGSYGKVSISIFTNTQLQDTQCVFCTCFANFSMKKERKNKNGTQILYLNTIVGCLVSMLLLLC